MKRKSSLLMMLLALFSAGAWAQTTYSGFTATAGTAGVSTSEGYAKLVDNSTSTKWCVISLGNPTYIEFNYSSAIVPTGYTLTTGGDTQSYPGRNPKSWKIMASTSSSTGPWELLTEVTGDDVLQAANTASYDFNLYGNGTAYRYFRFEISATGGSEFQLAELKLKKETNPTPIIKAKDINATGATLVMYSGISGNRTLQYGTNSSFTSGTYTEETISSGTPTKTLSGLTKGTTYYARVKNNNGGDWSNVVSFTPETIIGSLDNATDCAYLPTYHFYKYSLSQQIYTAGEIGMAGTINSVDFYYSGTASSPSRNLEVYMSSTSLSTITAWTTEDANNKVFDGTVTLNSGWNTITFSTPFTYDGTSNLLLTVYDKTGSYIGSCNFKVMSTTSNMAAYQYNDDENSVPKPTAASGTNNFTATNFKNILKLDITPSSGGGGSSYITEINNDNDWNTFAQNVRNGHSYSGETVTLKANISINSQGNQAGSEGNPFKGTFDGNGHTINVNMTATGTQCAPFYCIEDAVFKDLIVTGSITSGYTRLAGISGGMEGDCTFTNCVSNVNFKSTKTDGDVACGGFIGHSGGYTDPVFDGCAFTGSIEATGGDCAGFIGFHVSHTGWQTPYICTSHFTNCICAPSSINITSGDNATFVSGYNYGSGYNNKLQIEVTNCYYNTEAAKLGNKQGTRAYSVTGQSPVTVERSGDANTTYDVSGIAAYTGSTNKGLNFTNNGVTIIYAGNNDNITLNLGYTGEGTVNQYTHNGIAFTDNSNPYSLTMPNENVVIAVANISFTKEIEAYGTSARGGYYLIASPVGTEVTPSADNGFLSGTYDLYHFNQNAWDIVDNESVLHEWRNYDVENFSIASGTGYLYANKEGTTLTFTGTPYSGNGEVTLSKIEGPRFSGWNLVGNPFAQTAYFTNDFYTLNADRNEVVAGTTKSVEAMEGIFVVAANDGETMTFSTTPLGKSNSQMSINVVRNRGNVIDRAIVRFDEESLLPKFQLNPNHTKVYIPMEGKDYAVVYADAAGTMPVNFKAETDGTYTMNFNAEEVSFNYLHLVDNMTGADIDLLATPSYTFDARTTDYASRFKLVFATGEGSDDNFAFFSNGTYVINNDGNATLQVIDLTGRMLSSEAISGSCSKAINVAPGVYMLRLVNGNDVKVQKIVVK